MWDISHNYCFYVIITIYPIRSDIYDSTFFGHRDCPFQIESNLKHEIINLIESCSVDTFYVGNNGNFDKIAL